MKKFHVFSVLLALAAFAMLAGPASAEFIPVGDLLFQDTYNCTATNVFDLNANINSPTRVTDRWRDKYPTIRRMRMALRLSTARTCK